MSGSSGAMKLQEVESRYPWATKKIRALYSCNSSFAELCNDYEAVVSTLRRTNRVGSSERVTNDLETLKQDLEAELSRLLKEASAS